MSANVAVTEGQIMLSTLRECEVLGSRGTVVSFWGPRKPKLWGRWSHSMGSGHSTSGSSLSKTGWPNRVTVSQQRSRILMGWGAGSKVGKIGGGPEEGCS